MTPSAVRTAALALLGAFLCASCSSSSETDGTGGTGGSLPDPKCNGHAELCDRPFDEVAYPMTHNAMSNAEAGWISQTRILASPGN